MEPWWEISTPQQEAPAKRLRMITQITAYSNRTLRLPRVGHVRSLGQPVNNE